MLAAPLTNLSVQRIDDPSRLRAIAAEWRSLVERSNIPELVQHPEWMLPWWDVFGSTDKRAIRSVAFYDAGKLVGLAPLLMRPWHYRPRIPFRRLEMLASGEDEADESCSDYLGIIAEKGREGEIARAFADALVAGEAGAWDELVLPAMNGDNPLCALLKEELERHGNHVVLEEKNASPYATLPKTWDEYLASLKGQKRSQLKKALKALEAWAGGAPIIHRVRTKEEIPEAAKILEKLHRERWQGEGVYRSAKYRAFQDAVLPRMLDIGALELGWMSVPNQPGVPIAAFYNLRFDGRVLHYQSGRKMDLPDELRAGVTMHALLIKMAIEDGMREYDFLAGVSQYKMALATGQRPLLTLRAARPSVVESAHRAAERAIVEAKRLREYAQGKKGDDMAQPAVEKKQPRVLRALSEKTRPLFFGPHPETKRALFGWYHPPEKKPARGRAIVLCPPLGYENICAYPAMRELAERLAKLGYPVLRFDYEGTGDSGGLDSDPARVKSWTDSVSLAVDEVRALSGVEEVCLFGVRIGANLALAAAAERGDVERLVLWNACASGRAYAKELKMFRIYAEQTGELQARPKAEGDTNEESGGFLLTEETLKGLKTLEPGKLAKRPASHVLVIGRDDVPDDDKIAKAAEAQGASTKYEKLPGYAEMMVAPHKTVFPEAVFKALVDWLDAAPAEAKPVTAKPTAQERGRVAEGVYEEVVRFGPQKGFFAVLTVPEDEAKAKKNPLVIFSNTAGNYRIGPNRMYVEMGRKLAALGIASARLDVSGIGDSTIWDGEWPNHPYSEQLVDDVRALIKHLSDSKRFERFGVAGLCSGAYVAYHTAIAEPLVTSIALINLQIFKWEEGMSLEVNPLTRRDEAEYYKRRMFSKEAWMKLLQGGVDPRNAIRAGSGKILEASRKAIAKAKGRLPGAAKRGTPQARAFDALLERGTDVLFVFAAGDPGIDNLDEKIGPSMPALKARPNWKIDTIEGPDHSFTPLWAQELLDASLVGHLKTRFGG